MFDTTTHWRHFAAFSRWELASGGPDPQIDMVRRMADHRTYKSSVWSALCYIAVYNVPFGEVLWTELSWPSVLSASDDDVLRWCEDNFRCGRIVTRVERRTVRRPEWLADYIISARHWLASGGYDDMVAECSHVAQHSGGPLAAYEVAWQEVNRLRRVGRYVSLKLIELLRRDGRLPVETPDIRARGAWSPRRTLADLWPEHGERLRARDDSPETIALVDAVCRDTLSRLAGEYSVVADMFQLQVLLCEYREAWQSRRQYPGRSLDSELGYARRAAELWGLSTALWIARRELFPPPHLGEERGWEGPRDEMANCLADHGYIWSDLVYDYHWSLSDMGHPVRARWAGDYEVV